jgi:para-nitrobenzyl esterase
VYDAQSIANVTGAVVVTMNYRLGILGFLYDGAGLTGNYGLMDQEMALRWVQANIGAFGGDPSRVVLVGQSAGALSVASHLSRPASAGLFRAAVLHSAPFGLPMHTRTSGIHLTRRVAQVAACDFTHWSLIEACLLRKSPGELMAVQNAIIMEAARGSHPLQVGVGVCKSR